MNRTIRFSCGVSRLLLTLISVLLLLAPTRLCGQTVLFTEGFENNMPPTGWSTQQYNPSGNGWGRGFNSFSGNYSAGCYPNISNANSWLFTNALSLTQGKTYVLRYYSYVEAYGLLRITLGNAPNLPGQQQVIRNSVATSLNFVLRNDTLVCNETGLYYLGFCNYSSLSSAHGTYLDDISLTELNLPNCTTVSAGTASASVASTCVNTPFVLTNSGATVNQTGMRYAWQRSTDGANWTNINNGFAYPASLSVSQSVPTWYRMVDTCWPSGASAISNTVFVPNTSFLNCYCTPPALNCFNAASFTNVTVAASGLNNNTACSANGYGNFAGVGTITAYRGQSIYIQHTINNPNNYYPYTVGVWVDLNQNSVFEENEFALNGPFNANTGSSQFNIPASALPGETRMRMKVNVLGNIDANQGCLTAVQNGETEDYKVIIGNAPDCNGPVSAGTISAVATICPNTHFTLTAANTTVYQGQVRYAWQVSTDNINWSNLNNTGYLVNPLTVSQNSSNFYRLTDTCMLTGQTAVSNTITVVNNNIMGCYCAPQQPVNCTNDGIDSVSFGTIRNRSGCSANGYGNFTNLSTTVDNGTNLPIYIKIRTFPSVTKYVGVWIDFNRNGVLDNNERVVNAATTNNFVQANVNVPFNIRAGVALMRVVVNSGSLFGGCPFFSFGETEDYQVMLNPINPINNKFCYYVKQTATGQNNGTSWANAFTSLATAFTFLQSGDTLKIAKGIYTPGNAASNAFALKDSVVIWGGYPDTGNPSNADRNSSANPTILSGEIGAATVLTDNSNIILTANNVKDFWVDGVIIEKAYDAGTAIYGPVYINAASGLFKNTVIRNNINARFDYGTALSAVAARLSIVNCVIEGNGDPSLAPNRCLMSIMAKSNIEFINTVVAKNKGFSQLSVINSSVKITNSTFFKNMGFSSLRDSSSLTIENSLFYFNGGNDNADSVEFKRDATSTIAVSNSITEVYGTGLVNSTGQNPRFVDTARIAGADSLYFTADDGLRLINPCSPALNTGNNAWVAALSTDITGAPRIRNGIVDMGAYETQAPIGSQPTVLYVNRAATGLNDGSSWANAFTDLLMALNACSDTVKVAKGVYPISASDPFASIRLTNHRVLMGGYPDTGNPSNADINTQLYPSQIDGRINATLKCQNIISAVNNDSTCRMIGFELLNAAPPLTNQSSNFATIEVSNKSNPYFENIRLNSITNQALHLILVTGESRPTFYKCDIYNRFTRQNDRDGARFITIQGGSAPVFRRCYIGRDTSTATAPPDLGAYLAFTNAQGIIDSCQFFKAAHNAVMNQNSNTVIQHTVFTKGLGRSIVNTGATLLLNNCVFNDTANTFFLDYNGGALANTAGSNATITKCQFLHSYTYRNGAAVSNENSQMLLRNTAFKYCTSGQDGGIVFNGAGRMTLYNCISYNDGILAGLNPSKSLFLANNGGGRATLANCTIMGNTGATNPMIVCTTPTDTLQLYNSILWRYGYGAQQINLPNDINTVNNNNPATCDIRNSLLYKQSNTASTNTLIGINPRLIDFTNIEGIDGQVYSSDDGLKPATGSPAINSGNNALNPEATDFMGLQRVLDGTIDRGAYELQGNVTTARTYYVNQQAAPGGDGLSWATAYNQLQAAVLNNNADTIKVAQGLYKPATTNRDSCFNIYRHLVIWGGYPNTGNPSDAQRNPTAYPTVLSGDIGQPNDSTDNSYSVVQVHCADSSVTLDGLVVERGTFNKPNPIVTGGAGIFAIGNKQLNLQRCILRRNYATFGGGMYSFWSNLHIANTVFTNNNALEGGGFYIRDYYTVVNGLPWAPLVQFKKSVFANNKGGAGTIFGTGVIVSRNNIWFENTVVYRNEGSVAGFAFLDQPYVTVVNCLFAQNNNTALQAGIGILCSNSFNTNSLNTFVYNSIFFGNTVLGFTPSYVNSDFNWKNGNTQQATIPFVNLSNSATSGNQTGNSQGGIGSGSVTFKDLNNGTGPDGVWMTIDDGLQAGTFSNAIDKGATARVTSFGITQDILDSARIRNLLVDMGPYEAITSGLVSLCPGADSVTFTSTFTGASYQWQVDTGNAVFADISDNAQYRGTNTATLKIYNIPSAWYGYRYRCLLPNGTFDKVNQLKFAATWTGAVSNAWENPGNWSCGRVPDSFTDVTINNSTVVISSNVTIRSLRLNFGANVTVGTGFGLTVLY